MTYSLYRTRDGAGDSGPYFSIARLDEKGVVERQNWADKPKVGWNVTVGAVGARAYSAQDYWATTPVTEIVEDKLKSDDNGRFHYVRFKTGNSEYEWKKWL